MTTHNVPSEHNALHRRDRRNAWAWAGLMGREQISVWRLEALKALMQTAELEPGTIPAPEAVIARPLRARLNYMLGALSGLMLLAGWIAILRRGSSGLPAGVRRIVAIHGESATRTRHVLRALDSADPPVEAILLLGRLRQRPEAVAALWAKEGYRNLPPLVVPVSRVAAIRALADVPHILRMGWQAAGIGPGLLSPSVWAAIGFRVWYGIISARWWAVQAPMSRCEVIFGITGTADTTLLEKAVQRGGGRTVHAVHGQSAGPNFLGYSDLALFRTAHDAALYRSVSTYRSASAQNLSTVTPRRGEAGLVLFTNLAHPMNADFQLNGPLAEMRVLETVAAAARALGPSAQPLYWKPHPAIDQLSPEVVARIRATAEAVGFTELTPGTPSAEHAALMRWAVATPSTVAVELLASGVLCLLLDPHEAILESALGLLPKAPCDEQALAKALAALGPTKAYEACLANAWKAIGPARPLDLSMPLT